GILGCPVCRAEYPVRDGIAWFAPPGSDLPRPGKEADEQEALRIAAFLDLVDPAGFAVLHGAWAAHAPIVGGLSPVHPVLLDPPTDVHRGPGVTIIRANGLVPLARGPARAATFGETATAETRDALLAAVRAGGRILGTAETPVPDGVREIARDDRAW